MPAPFDLHIHTLHSDGVDTPAQIIEMAQRSGLSVIAITDHDTVRGVKEAGAAAAEAGIELISGVEVTTRFNDHALHILGYGVDIRHAGLLEMLADNRSYRRQHFLAHLDQLNAVFAREGKREIKRDEYIRSQGEYFSKPGLARFIQQLSNASSRAQAFDYANLLPDPAPQHLSPAQAITTIHAAGGKAVVAHPLCERLSIKEIFATAEEQTKAVSNLHKQGLDGLEVYQSCHNVTDEKFALQLALKFGLLVTGGTDWHGSYESEGASIPWEGYARQLGDLRIDSTVVEELIASWQKVFGK